MLPTPFALVGLAACIAVSPPLRSLVAVASAPRTVLVAVDHPQSGKRRPAAYLQPLLLKIFQQALILPTPSCSNTLVHH